MKSSIPSLLSYIPDLPDQDRIWLEAIYAENLQNRKPTTPQIRSRLRHQLPRNYSPQVIDRRLIHPSNEEITLLGIIAITGSDDVLEKSDRVIYALQEIEQFLHEAVEYPVGTTVMRCANIDEYVFAEMDTESQGYASYYPRIGQLYFIEHSFGQYQHFSELVDHFTSLYSDCIQKHCYSKDAGQWDFFSAIDQRRLQEIAKSFKTSPNDPN